VEVAAHIGALRDGAGQGRQVLGDEARPPEDLPFFNES